MTEGAVPERERDVATEERNVARSRLQVAAAEAAQVRAVLERTRITSPIDGVVVSRSVEALETVTPGTPLFTVVDLDQLRVEAEIDEFDVARLEINLGATVAAEGFPGSAWQGTVEEIPVAIAPRKLRSADPSRITDSGVVLAKLTLPKGTPLKLGQRVLVKVSTTPRAELPVR